MKTEKDQIELIVSEKRWDDLADQLLEAVVCLLVNCENKIELEEHVAFILEVMMSERMEMVARGIGDTVKGDSERMIDFEEELRSRGDNRDADWYKVGKLLVNLMMNWPENEKTVWREGIAALVKKIENLINNKLDIRQTTLTRRICQRVVAEVGIVESE
jgi:hypothetical protein